jgi:hypothetical protein
VARTSEKDRAKTWHTRLKAANKAYEEWERRFNVAHLENWYLGDKAAHWPGWTDEERERYITNLIYASMEAKKPSLLFFRPQAVLTGKPSRSDDPGTPIELRTKLREDTLNQFAADPRVKLRSQTLLALHESFFRFGVIEVGYTADFIDNPRAGKPMLVDEKGEDTEANHMKGEDGMPVMQPEQILSDEALYVKRIPAKQFRFPESSNNVLEWNDWYAYYTWENLSDLKKNPQYKNRDTLKAGGKMKSDDAGYNKDEDGDKAGKVKVWRIYDLRAKQRLILPDNGEKFLHEKPISFAPHSILAFHPILDEGLPLPPVFNWLHPQKEYNEIREDMRVYRRGGYRRYTYKDGAIDEDQLVKLENGGDGVYAKANTDMPLQEVPQGKLNQGVLAGAPVTKEDFNNVTAVSSEQRNSAEAETATQAQIKEMRSNIRESFSRYQVAEWLADIFRLMLKTIEENMALPFWVQTSVDPTALGIEQEVTRIAQSYMLIKSEQLGPLEYDVTVDVESLSPASQETKKREFMDVMTNVFGNPGAAMFLALSPSLLKRLLEHMGIRSETILMEVQQALAAMQMMMMQGQGGGPSTPGGPQPGPTPDLAGTAGQLQQQMGGPIQ